MTTPIRYEQATREVHDIIQKWTRRGYIVAEVAHEIEDDLRGVIRPSNLGREALIDLLRETYTAFDYTGLPSIDDGSAKYAETADRILALMHGSNG